MTWRLEAEKIGINLPPGFWLEEDEDFLYLKYGEETVATFSSRGADPRAVEGEARKQSQQKLGK